MGVPEALPNCLVRAHNKVRKSCLVRKEKAKSELSHQSPLRCAGKHRMDLETTDDAIAVFLPRSKFHYGMQEEGLMRHLSSGALPWGAGSSFGTRGCNLASDLLVI
eukprot:1141396-Pelagomonas_calceolata.AAC.6